MQQTEIYCNLDKVGEYKETEKHNPGDLTHSYKRETKQRNTNIR